MSKRRIPVLAIVLLATLAPFWLWGCVQLWRWWLGWVQ